MSQPAKSKESNVSTSTIESMVRREMVGYLVSKEILCSVTGEVLDARTCVVMLGADGDPRMVMSQAGWAEVRDVASVKLGLARLGVTVDPETVTA